MTVEIFHNQSPRKNVADLGGVEPATSWSPVGRRIQLSHQGRHKVCYHMGHAIRKRVFWHTGTAKAITKTCLYNFDPLIPHFYIVKLGFRGVYIIFQISAQNIDCGYSLEPPRRGGSNEYPQSMFRAEIWKISGFFIWKFSVFGGEIFYIFE